MKLVLFSFLLFAYSSIAAQTRWSQGVVVLKDEKVEVGQLQFHLDVLLLKDGEVTRIYPAHQIASFRYYDSTSNINRHYLSLSDPRFVFPVLRFFEVVTWGEIAVVRRDNHPLLNENKNDVYFSYFSLRENELISLKKFKSKLYDMLLEKYPLRIREYVSSQHLSLHRLGDAIRIIKFYNQQAYAPASIAAL